METTLLSHDSRTANLAKSLDPKKVEQAFAGFEEKFVARSPHSVPDMRGGNKLPAAYHKKSFVPGYLTFSEDFHRETSFDFEQRPFVGMAVALLRDVARDGLPAKNIPPLEQRIIDDMTIQMSRSSSESPIFTDAVTASVAAVISDCLQEYPSLLRAYQALFYTAGFHGTCLAINDVSRYLSYAINGKLDSTLVADKDRGMFYGLHMGDGDSDWGYEIYCNGMPFAWAIQDGSHDAAGKLAENKTLVVNYQSYVDVFGIGGGPGDNATKYNRIKESLEKLLPIELRNRAATVGYKKVQTDTGQT